MKLFTAQDKSQALCHRDGRVTTTFEYRDVPFDDGHGRVRDILVGVCDRCGDVVSIPAQSMPAIRAARRRADHAVEINLSAHYLEILDAACYRIDAAASTDMRKRLLFFYVQLFSDGSETPAQLAELAHQPLSPSAEAAPRRRLSLKVSEAARRKLEELMGQTGLNRTELIKALIQKIYLDQVLPDQPLYAAELLTLTAVLYA